MKMIWALAARDLRVWFAGAAGFVVPPLFAVVAHGLFFGVYGFFDAGQVEMRGFFHSMPWLVLFLAPALAMGGYAAERGRGTDEVLRALPISEGRWVAGKFVAGLVQIALCLAATVSLPVSLMAMGNPDPGPLWTAYVGSFLLAAAALAVCQLVSNLMRSQVAAYLGGALVLFVWLLIGNAPVIAGVSGWFDNSYALAALTEFMNYVGWISHFANFERGLVDSRDVAYFVAVGGAALVLNTALLRYRRLP